MTLNLKVIFGLSLLIGIMLVSHQLANAGVYVPGAKTKVHTKKTTEYNRVKKQTRQSEGDQAEPENQEFGNSLEEMKAKVKAFSGNAESMLKMVNDSDEKTIEENKNKVVKISESMIENNGRLQDLAKKLAEKEKNDQIRNILTRGVLANLQNVNRQLSRIKLAAEKDKVNYSNMKQQVERVDESIKQVIDRLESYEKQ